MSLLYPIWLFAASVRKIFYTVLGETPELSEVEVPAEGLQDLLWILKSLLLKNSFSKPKIKCKF